MKGKMMEMKRNLNEENQVLQQKNEFPAVTNDFLFQIPSRATNQGLTDGSSMRWFLEEVGKPKNRAATSDPE